MGATYNYLNQGGLGVKVTPRLSSNGVVKSFSQFDVNLVNPLILTWDDIANVPVTDASSVSDWNTFFDLPAYGTPFTSVVVSGNVVNLIGGSRIILKDYLFANDKSLNLLEFNDTGGSLSVINSNVFSWYSGACSNMTSVRLPNVTSIGSGAFQSNTSLTEIYIPSCTSIGNTVGMEYVFYSIIGNIITLTIPSILMTCNGGNPDGDIQYLMDNNTITIITV